MSLQTKTAYAFTFTAERLAAWYPRIYFWTLTFREVPYNDVRAMSDWALFRRRLCHRYPSLKGVRVCELHKSHGIHFHLLLNLRISLDDMNKLGHPLGLGRMSVSEADKNCIGYLAKYLTKQYRNEFDFGGRRRWGTIGGFKPCRVRDVVFEMETSQNCL